jgi:hypothetical protein
LKATQGGKSFRELTLASTKRWGSDPNLLESLTQVSPQLGGNRRNGPTEVARRRNQLSKSSGAIKSRKDMFTQKAQLALRTSMSSFFKSNSDQQQQQEPKLEDFEITEFAMTKSSQNIADETLPKAEKTTIVSFETPSTTTTTTSEEDSSSSRNSSSETTEDASNTSEEAVSLLQDEKPLSPVKVSAGKMAPRWLQLYLFCYRGILQQIREPRTVLVSMLLASCGAGAIGLANLGMVFPEKQVSPSHALLSLASGLVAITSSIRCFGSEQVVFWRESRAGTSTSVYFLAKNISQLPWLLVLPLFLLSLFSIFSPPQGNFWVYYAVLFAACFNSSGMAYIVSIIFIPSNATIVGSLYPLICSVFGSVSPSLVSLRETAIGTLMTYVSYTRWVVETLLMNEVSKETNYLFIIISLITN